MAKKRDIRGGNTTKHHIVPSSRGGKTVKRNITFVDRDIHDPYHQLFSNMTPEEIVIWLNKTFWNNNYEIEIYEKNKK